MALPSSIQAILARFRGSNNNAYNATSNPLGLGQGGHRQNFGPRLKDTADVVDWMAGSVDAIDADATTASNAAGTATSAATAAGSARDKANLWANAPEDQEVETGKFSAFHFMRKAMAQVGLAGDKVQLAADQVALAAVQAQRLQGTSTTSQTPSVASKTFTTQSGKAFDVGNSLLVQSRGNIDRWMSGRVTAYSGTSVTIAVEAIGTVTSAATDWDLRVNGVRGVQGIQGIPGIATMPYSARTSNTTLVAGDSASLIDLTGSFTQAFSAAATLGANWYAFVRNNGTGDITLKPNGSETIDGLASFISYPGEVRLVQCDGTALRSIVLAPFSKTFAQSDTFVKPPGYKQFGGIIRSGGASGARAAANANAFGGAGGGAFPFVVPAEVLPASAPLTVGSGGASVTTDDTAGNLGGDSSFAGIVVGSSSPTSGGAVGKALTSSAAFTIGFDPSSNNISGARALYGGGSAVTNSPQNQAGSSVFGGASGASIASSNAVGTPGISTFAGNGGTASLTAAGASGAAPSGGGAGSRNGYPSGAGARGQIDIYGVA